MHYLYLIVPIFNVAALIALIYLLLREFKLKSKRNQFKQGVLILLTLIVITVGVFLSLRFTEMALFPSIETGNNMFVWQGRRYIYDGGTDSTEAPPIYERKFIAYEKRADLFLDVFFPYKIYQEKNNPKNLWKIGIMEDEKYIHID